MRITLRPVRPFDLARHGDLLILVLFSLSVLTATAGLFSHARASGQATAPLDTVSPSAAANDTCASATIINPASLPFAEDSTTVGANNDVDPGGGACGQGQGPDVVYSFTPDATDVYTIGATPFGTAFDMSLYIVTDCSDAGGTCVGAANASGLSKGESLTPVLTAGTRYFIVVDSPGLEGNAGQFHFSIRRGTPSNDTCSSPVVIEPNRLPFMATGTTFGATDDLNPETPCLRSRQSGTGPEVVFQFTPADTQNYLVTVTPIANFDATVYIVTNCSNFANCSGQDIGGNGTAESLRRNLTAGTTYYIVVDGFRGDAGDFTLAFEPTIPLAPQAPTGLAATVVSATEIALAWSDNSGNEQGFRIERSLDGSNFTEIATVAPNTTMYSDTTVFANTTFFYRVFAFNNFGNSDSSNIAAATTPPPPAPPNPVISLSPSEIDFGTVGTLATRTLTISNAGGNTLSINAISDPPAPFSVDKPALPLTIAPGQSVELRVRFTPNRAQAFAGFFTIESNDPGNPIVTVNLRGIGSINPVPNLEVSQIIIDFPGGSSSRVIEVRNTGDADLIVASLSAPGSPFSFSGRPNLPAVYKPGEGFFLTVAFSPGAPGVFNTTATLVSSDPDSLITVLILRGTSTPQNELLKLRVPTQVVAVAGASTTLNVLAVNGTNTDITLSAGNVAGGTFTNRGNGRADLVITPASDARGSLLVNFTARDSANREKTLQSVIMIVEAAAAHEVQVSWTAASAPTNPPTNVAARDLSITPLSLEGAGIETVDPAQTGAVAGYVIYRSQSPNVPQSLSNIVGIVFAGQNSFTGRVPSPAGSPQVYYYRVSTLSSSGAETTLSNESSTAPQVIGLQFRSKGLRFQAANSNVAVGAVLIVDGRETYALGRSGDLIVVGKSARSTPGGLKPVKLFTSGSTHSVQVRNPNGAVSASQTFTR